MTKYDDVVVEKDARTNSYVNGRGEALKFTNNSVSVYDKTPDQPDHISTHITKHGTDEQGRDKISATITDSDGTTERYDGHCYLTTACMVKKQEKFDDNCDELTTLRWFRDNYVSTVDIKDYYKYAPKIIEEINKIEDNKDIYNFIYDTVIADSVYKIKIGDYQGAYDRYRKSYIALKKMFVNESSNDSEKGKVFLKK